MTVVAIGAGLPMAAPTRHRIGTVWHFSVPATQGGSKRDRHRSRHALINSTSEGKSVDHRLGTFTPRIQETDGRSPNSRAADPGAAVGAS